MAVHAIGDRAVDEVLELLRDVAANNTGRVVERRHRVEHAQHLSGPEVSAKAAAPSSSRLQPVGYLVFIARTQGDRVTIAMSANSTTALTACGYTIPE